MLRPLTLLITCLLAILAAPSESRAEEPTVYYFGASECDYCEAGKSFLERWKAVEAGLQLNVYDIVKESGDALLYVRVTGAIGIVDTVVPMTIIGDHVILGFHSDATTGDEIRGVVQHCRQVGCPDVVRMIIDADSVQMITLPKNLRIQNKYVQAAMRH